MFQLFQITNDDRRRNETNLTKGPLSDLEDTKFNYNVYQYPIIQNEDTPDLGHNIIFYQNIPERSFWNTSGLVPDANGGPKPVVDRNNLATAFGLRNPDAKLDIVGSDLGMSPATADALGNSMMGDIQRLLKKNKRTTTAISLYVPPTMAFTHSVQYENVSLTKALGQAGNLGYTGLMAATGQLGKATFAASGLLDLFSISTALRNVVDPDTVRDIVMQQNFGIADNPQNVMLFRQIDFRKFQFQFLMSADNQKEANVIEEIIYQFRFGSVPEVTSDSLGRFFTPPNTWDIEFLHNGKINNYIPQISTCFLEQVTVDYAPNNNWSTHYDGTPKQIQINLNFVETEILTRDRVSDGF